MQAHWWHARWRVCAVAILAWSLSPAAWADAQSANPSPAPNGNAPTTETAGEGEEFLVVCDEQTAAQIDNLIRDLGAPDHHARERATTELTHLGIAPFAKLREAYRKTTDLEVRLRIERIVSDAYLEHHLFSKNGFLGISQDPSQVMTERDDRRIEKGCMGVFIETVMQGTAASRAGLRTQDVIVAFDGDALPLAADPATAFSETIRTRGPGATIVMTVLRGGVTKDIKVTLGARPKRYYQRDEASKLMLLIHQKRLARWWREHFVNPPSEESPQHQPASISTRYMPTR